VCEFLVWKWRKALGVNCRNCPGTQRLLRAASGRGAAQVRGKELPPEQVERRRRTAAELDLGRHRSAARAKLPRWAPAEVRLLGKLPDEEVAARMGRTHNAVRIKRERLGIPNPRDRRRCRG
jgi:hypothetical protein